MGSPLFSLSRPTPPGADRFQGQCYVRPEMQLLSGMLVVDFSRYLPGAFASRELLELGARVVCVEPPGGDPMRNTAPAWDDALRAGKESLEVDLKRDAAPALELLREADVVLESFRPGVASRLGIGPEHALERTVYCSITGFGLGGRHEQRAGHDLNYLGWAGALWDTSPTLPPVQIADLAAGALGGVSKILAALLERVRTARGGRHARSTSAAPCRLGARPPRAAGARTSRPGRPRRRPDHPRPAPPRRAPPRRRRRAAPAHRRTGVLPHLRDRRRPPSLRRRTRAGLLPPPDGAARPAGAGGA